MNKCVCRWDKYYILQGRWVDYYLFSNLFAHRESSQPRQFPRSAVTWCHSVQFPSACFWSDCQQQRERIQHIHRPLHRPTKRDLLFCRHVRSNELHLDLLHPGRSDTRLCDKSSLWETFQWQYLSSVGSHMSRFAASHSRSWSVGGSWDYGLFQRLLHQLQRLLCRPRLIISYKYLHI